MTYGRREGGAGYSFGEEVDKFTSLNGITVHQCYDVVRKSRVGEDVPHMLTLRLSVAVGLFKVAGATVTFATAVAIATDVRCRVHRCTW